MKDWRVNMLYSFGLGQEILNRGHDTLDNIAEAGGREGLIDIIWLGGTGVTPIQAPREQAIPLFLETLV
jgi:hypothetical protein